jgi:hypothetical protein
MSISSSFIAAVPAKECCGYIKSNADQNDGFEDIHTTKARKYKNIDFNALIRYKKASAEREKAC